MDKLKVRLFLGMFHLVIMATFIGCLMVPNLVYASIVMLISSILICRYSIERATGVDNYSWQGMVVGNVLVLCLCVIFLMCHFWLILLKMGTFDKCISSEAESDSDGEENSVIAKLWDDYPLWLLIIKVLFLGMS
jgi:hypothetical protein